MTNINNSMRTANMPQNCGMKGMHENHENHAKKAESANTQQPAQVEKAMNERTGNKLDVRV